MYELQPIQSQPKSSLKFLNKSFPSREINCNILTSENIF